MSAPYISFLAAALNPLSDILNVPCRFQSTLTRKGYYTISDFSCLHDKERMANPPVGPDNHYPVKSLQSTSPPVFQLSFIPFAQLFYFTCTAHISASNAHLAIKNLQPRLDIRHEASYVLIKKSLLRKNLWRTFTLHSSICFNSFC